MSNVSTLERIVFWANVLVIVSLALSLASGAASIIFSRLLNNAKDEQAAREKQISDEKIALLTTETEQAKTERAEADKQIAIAKADAAKANEGLANATARIEEARADSARANEQAQNAHAAAAEARTKTAQALREQESLRKQNLELALQVEQERLARVKIEERIQPRGLSAAQYATILKELTDKQKGMVGILWMQNDPESQEYARQFNDLFNKAGWRSYMQQAVTGRIAADPALQTLVIRTRIFRDGEENERVEGIALAKILHKALTNAGIEVSLDIDTIEYTVGSPTLIIGHKPFK